jgi:hypothetical protein
MRAGGFPWKSGAEITQTQVLEFPGKPPEPPAAGTSQKFETRPQWEANGPERPERREIVRITKLPPSQIAGERPFKGKDRWAR